MIVDIHSHNLEEVDGIKIFNLSITDSVLKSELLRIKDRHLLFSLGVHPWDTINFNKSKISEYINLFSHEDVVAIGEIGLDSLKGSKFQFQYEIFEAQLKIASELKKPVILHVVKSISHILKLKNKYTEIPSWIIHGFRGNIRQAEMYLSRGFYLSFGERYNTDTIKGCPLDKLFIESDDSGKDIDQIYEKISNDLDISQERLENQIMINYCNVFKK